MVFSDGTMQTVYTTINREILEQHGVEPKENFFFDLAHDKFVPFREDAIDVQIYKEKPIYGGAVNEFASRFI